MDFEPVELGRAIGMIFAGASFFLLTAAIAWRIGVRPTMRALMEYRGAHPAADPQLVRRLSELEDEVRGLKARLGQLPEGSASRELIESPWRPTRERS